MADFTLPVKEKIAVVFDFDETLAPPTHLKMLEKTGIDQQERENYIQKLLDEGWDKILARAYSWVKYSQDGEARITRQMFQEIGEELELFEGVDTLFDRLRSFCPDDDVDVEFYLLTAGFVEIPESTSIAQEFKQIWGGAYAFDDEDKLVFIRRILTHEQKREYIQQLAKGTGLDGPSAPADSHQHIPEEDMYVPFTQIIYVGDGASDRPAFSLLHEKGGVAIGLAKDSSATWKEGDRLKKNQKVDNLLSVDYTEGSELMQCLQLAIESICRLIMLRKVGKD
jgi:phosphoserine phosphatase